jgi:hypothetical protein
MAYNVYLAGLGRHGLTDAETSAVKSSLQTWFNLIDGDSVVSWVTAAPSIQEHELLCYFVTDSDDSIVKSLIGKAGSGNGITGWTSETGSEVYVSKSRGFLAEMAFHELLHNKLHLDDAALHKKDGLAVATVTAGMNPSTQNIADMKAKLNDKQKQWTTGFTSYNDPMRSL